MSKGTTKAVVDVTPLLSPAPSRADCRTRPPLPERERRASSGAPGNRRFPYRVLDSAAVAGPVSMRPAKARAGSLPAPSNNQRTLTVIAVSWRPPRRCARGPTTGSQFPHPARPAEGRRRRCRRGARERERSPHDTPASRGANAEAAWHSQIDAHQRSRDRVRSPAADLVRHAGAALVRLQPPRESEGGAVRQARDLSSRGRSRRVLGPA